MEESARPGFCWETGPLTPESHSKRRVARLVLPFLVGAVAGVASLGLIPPASEALGPARVSVSAEVAAGRTVVTVPPLGTISAATHPAPVEVEMTFKNVDFEELGPLATTSAGRAELLEQMDEDLRDVIRTATLRFALGAAIVGAIAAALLWHRRWLQIALGAGGALVGVAALLGVTLVTFDNDAFEQPRYSGTLARAPIVIETLRETPSVLDSIRSRYETATRRLSDLLVLVAQPDTDPRTDTTSILHISDIHANPLGLEIADELVRGFEVDAVLDTGDLASSTIDTGSLTSLAEPIDRQMTRLIERLEVPYYFVPGNHDSPRLLSALKEAANVTVFDEEIQTISGIDVLGWADPTFTTDSSVTIEEKDEARLETADEVAAEVLAQSPHVLAVHDDNLAAQSYGNVPLVVAGHGHERDLRREEGTIVVAVGSTGATGLKSLTLEADKSYEAEILYFRGTEIVAVDYVTFHGSNDFVVERTTFEEELPDEAEPAGGTETP